MSRRKLNSVEPLESRRLLTVLTFDPVSANAAVLPTTYGDRITTASKAGFNYGAAGGITPGITVSYGPDATNVRQWKDGYGDLHNILFAGDSAKGILDITLSADLGSQVNLASLDLGGGANTDYTINSFSIFDGGSNVLFTQSNLKVEGDANGALHTHLDFSSIHSRVLRIHIDASNLGTNGDQIGVDNIQFSQLDTASPVGDGYADVVLNYHDSGVGPIPGPYGGTNADVSAQPVGLGVVLGGDPDKPDYLSLPTGSSVTVGFADETIVDGPGADLAITELVDTGEQANVFVSSDFINFTKLGVAKAGRVNKFDLASIGYTDPVRAVKIVGLDNNGGSPGFDVVNVQAIASAMRSETFRFPIGNGTDVPTISTTFGGDNPANTQHGSLGEEYATPVGKNVFPFMWGKVLTVISGDASLGNAVIIEHTLADQTKIYSLYAHLSKVLVTAGVEVTTNTKIGLTGETGDSTSPNLRFGIFAGDPSTAGTQYLGTDFSNSLASQTDPNGIVHYKPSTFITDSSALNLGFATMSNTGALSVTGTSGDDTIALSANDGRLAVTQNGVTRAVDQSITRSITITALSGNDNVSVNGAIIGTYVDGGDGNDLLSGGDSKDTLTGGAGKNTLLGNGGDDRLDGSGSRDSIDGGDGDDRLYGNGGDDSLSGDAGVDRLFGGDGNDLLLGGSSNDKLYGEAGDDTLFGNNQNDSLEGGSGDDSIIGGGGIDTLIGNAGNDTLQAHDGAADSLDGGSGTDQASVDEVDTRISIESLLK